jgi:hypothetical protein
MGLSPGFEQAFLLARARLTGFCCHLKGGNVLRDALNQLPEIINKVFDVLDLLVVRTTILGLAALGAYALFKHHV